MVSAKKLVKSIALVVASLALAAGIDSTASAAPLDVLKHYQHGKVLAYSLHLRIQHDKVSFIDKTIKEANTKEGRALLSAVALWVGVNPAGVNAGAAALAATLPNQGVQDSHSFFGSPAGFSICMARPAGSIETHGDTTWNATIARGPVDGVGMYTVVPFKVRTDTRVEGSFILLFVRKDVPNWMSKYHCDPTGSHPWLARNNETRLRVAQ